MLLLGLGAAATAVTLPARGDSDASAASKPALAYKIGVVCANPDANVISYQTSPSSFIIHCDGGYVPEGENNSNNISLAYENKVTQMTNLALDSKQDPSYTTTINIYDNFVPAYADSVGFNFVGDNGTVQFSQYDFGAQSTSNNVSTGIQR